MENDPYQTSWRIEESDNHGSFPKGEIQKLKQIGMSNSYELKWKAGAVDCSIAPLFPDPVDPNILSNPKAKGVKGSSVGIYDVKIVLSPAAEGLEKLSGISQDSHKVVNSPGPLVGQWGAETPPPTVERPGHPGRPVAVDNDR